MKKYKILLEKDNRKTIQKLFKFPDGIVDSLHEISSKYSLVLANYLFNKVSSQRGLTYELKSVIKNIEKKKSLDSYDLELYQNFMNDYFGNRGLANFRYLRDWLHGRGQNINPDENIKDLKNLSFDDAYTYAEKWHEYLKKGAGGSLDTGKIVIQFPDGFYWVDLETNVCEVEAKAGGHCGRGEFDDDSNLYSLRSPQHKIILTADVNRKTKDVRQIRGTTNTKPKEKHHGYILDFLLNKKIGVKIQSFKKAWKPQLNFSLDDLSDVNYKKVIKVHPDWEFTQVTDEFIDNKIKEVMRIHLSNYIQNASVDENGILTFKVSFFDDQSDLQYLLSSDLFSMISKEDLYDAFYYDEWESRDSEEIVKYIIENVKDTKVKEIIEEKFPKFFGRDEVDVEEWEEWEDDLPHSLDGLNNLINRACEQAWYDEAYDTLEKDVIARLECAFEVDFKSTEEIILSLDSDIFCDAIREDLAYEIDEEMDQDEIMSNIDNVVDQFDYFEFIQSEYHEIKRYDDRKYGSIWSDPSEKGEGMTMNYIETTIMEYIDEIKEY